jgi:hypothetical protein
VAGPASPESALLSDADSYPEPVAVSPAVTIPPKAAFATAFAVNTLVYMKAGR